MLELPRAWEGKITESVEFKVHGKTPDEFYNYSWTVSELIDGNSYLWEWKNETIYDEYVYIVYYGNYSYDPFPPSAGGIISIILICSILIIGILGFVYLITRLENIGK